MSTVTKPYFQDNAVTIFCGDCREILKTLSNQSVHCCVTSPPYFGLRDYGHDGQIGLEQTPDAYVAELVNVFREVRRILRDDGTLWLNMGDSYASSGVAGPISDKCTMQHGKGINPKHAKTEFGRAPTPTGLKPKDLIGIPWRVAFALQADGWYLRQDIIWHKPNPMPESVRDRCTKAHEYVFLLSKSARYYYDAEAIAEDAQTAGKIGGFTPNAAIAAGVKPTGNMIAERGKAYIRKDTRNRRSVWTVATKPFKGSHFATFPPKLIEPCVLAGCPAGGTVLDPFNGAGTTGLVAIRQGREYIGCELNPEYAELTKSRLEDELRQEVLPL